MSLQAEEGFFTNDDLLPEPTDSAKLDSCAETGVAPSPFQSPPMAVETRKGTHRRHPVNEDCPWSYDQGTCYAMAIFDGMGGHYGGQFASRAAVKALEQQRNLSDRDPRQWLAQMFDLVSAAISKEAEEIKQLIIDIGQRIQKEGLTSANCDELTALVNPLVDFELAGAHIRIVMQNLDANRTISLLEEILPDVEKMAATGVLAHVKMTGAGRWLVNVGNVGDPRAYLFAGNKLMQLTSDQTPFQDWLTNHGQGVSEKVALERKAAIEKAVTPGAVSGWLGHYDPERRFYSQPIELNSPFVLALLCDGIHKHQGVTDERLKSIFRRSTDATWLCRALMDAAAGALDDRTCVVLSIP